MKPVAFLCLLCSLLSCCEQLADAIISEKCESVYLEADLAQGKKFQSYSGWVAAEIKNGDADSYDYGFAVSGNLPPGTHYDINGRTVVVSGVPIVAGNYTFKVKVQTSVAHTEESHCDDDVSASQNFTIKVVN